MPIAYDLGMGHRQVAEPLKVATIGPQLARSMAQTLAALAAPSRLMILGRLRQGPASVTELADAVSMEQSAVSHQLRHLRDLGIVEGRRDGRRVTYQLYDIHVAALLDEAVHHLEHRRAGLVDVAKDGGVAGEL